MIEVRQTETFARWLADLRDDRAQARINARIRRLSVGNAGEVKPAGGGISEMRIDYGPGYRVYFMQRGEAVIILLAGGDKSTQDKDIATARGSIGADDAQDQDHPVGRCRLSKDRQEDRRIS